MQEKPDISLQVAIAQTGAFKPSVCALGA